MKNLFTSGVSIDDLDDLLLDPRTPQERAEQSVGWNRYPRRARGLYSYLEKFLDSRIGYSYNRAKNDFVEGALNKGFPKAFLGEPLEVIFENQFEENRNGWPVKYCKYYVRNGVIKKNPPTYTKKKQEVIIEPAQTLYFICRIDRIKEFEGLYDIMMDVLGWRKMDRISNERLDANEVKAIKNNEALRRWITEEIVLTGKAKKRIRGACWVTLSSKNTSELLDYIFEEIKSPEKKLKHSDPMYKKTLAVRHHDRVAHKKKLHSKAHREEAHQAIYDRAIEKEREAKLKERLNDIINRDRHGFDEESFKGEFYHGQKRKKKI